MKDVTYSRQPVFLFIQLNERSLPALLFSALQKTGYCSVIRTHVKPVADLRSHRAARGPHPWVDNNNMDSTLWEVRYATSECICCLRDILCRNHVAQICNLRGGTNPPDHPFHHTGIPILDAKICHQCNHGHSCSLSGKSFC